MRANSTAGRATAMALVWALMAALAVALAPPVQATTGDLTGLGCITNIPMPGCDTAPAQALSAARTSVVSPDGANLYAANLGNSTGTSSVTSFTRSPAGGLSQIGCITASAVIGCTTASPASLYAARGIAISPDGSTVYVVSQNSDSITWFTRNKATGLLSQAGCISNTDITGCTTAPASSLERAYGVAVSPDGKNVYVAAGTSDAVTWFSRNTSTGSLLQTGCLANTPIAGCATASPESFDFSVAVTVSPDGRFVYVASGSSRAVNWLTRDPTTGGLTQAGCITDTPISGCTTAPRESLQMVTSISISPDATSAYTAAYDAGGVTSFSRDRATGALTQTGCISDPAIAGCATAPAGSLLYSYVAAVSPDGANVYATGYTYGVVTTLARDVRTGLLSWVGCTTSSDLPGCTLWTPDSLWGGAFGVSFSPDSAYVYVSSGEANAITWFARKRGQSISFPQPSTTQLSAGAVKLAATASSGLPVAYASTTSAVCSVRGTSARLIAPGNCTITASQAGSTTWNTAAAVTRTFAVIAVQVPLSGCVTAPSQIPRRGLVQVMKAGCMTNARQPVQVRAQCQPRSRGELRFCALTSNSRGATVLRTFGRQATIRLTWSAPAIGPYPAYRASRVYRT